MIAVDVEPPIYVPLDDVMMMVRVPSIVIVANPVVSKITMIVVNNNHAPIIATPIVITIRRHCGGRFRQCN